ncbi:MAG: potassium channel protein [Deltaproteobacteria bacterium]|nr:potassium channel protein [Deltaproteobacteria bacterium]MBW2050791.1 potassium channel protein [Deltaproteobacteria bacterium]MBW2139540.1 potassium channel protein [Deltaproteobacteria bacterium]MBW2321943.1 potassium channel protein [Deltaproteobacteria bacterium]
MENNSSRRNLIVSICLSLLILLCGTIGYTLIEGWPPLDALYMTIITVATIGYGEIRPLSPLGRVFTIFIILFGVGNVAYLVGQLTRTMVETSLRRIMGRRKLERQIKAIKDHYIICGYGRIGRVIAKEIAAKNLPLVIIENNHEVIEQIDQSGYLYIIGEAVDDEKLIAAGIERARGLVSVVNSDADNVYIVLTARAMNENLYIVTRAGHEKSVSKLKRAGADKVVSPYQIGARNMAQTLLRPAVSDFIESTVHGQGDLDLAMEEILVTSQSELKDITLKDSNIRQGLDLIVIAIKTAEGKMIFNPWANARFQVGDTLIAVGERGNMNRLAKMLGADSLTRYPTRKAPNSESQKNNV